MIGWMFLMCRWLFANGKAMKQPLNNSGPELRSWFPV